MRLQEDRVRVSAPATITGIGGGPESFALALGLKDTAVIRAVAGPTRIHAQDTAASDPGGEDHPIVAALRTGLDHVGASQVGVEMWLQGAIPRNRGVGSFSAATLMGLAAAFDLVGERPSVETLVDLAGPLGADPLRVRVGHAGGGMLHVPTAYPEKGVPTGGLYIPFRPPPLISPVLLIPDFSAEAPLRPDPPLTLPQARTLGARTALLALLLAGEDIHSGAASFPELLLAATQDHYGWAQLEDTVPASVSLVGWLRDLGIPAVISGDGPAVVSLLALGPEVAAAANRSGWEVIEP